MPHFRERLVVAMFLFYELKRSGTIGGRNVPASALRVVRAKLWASLDYGRATAPIQTPGHKTMATRLQRFQLKVLKELLGLSTRATKNGVLGETGELPDIWRERQRQLLVSRQMLHAPVVSLPRRRAAAAQRAEEKAGVFRVVSSFLSSIAGNSRGLEDFRSKKDIKNFVLSQAEKQWKSEVLTNTRLRDTYTSRPRLYLRG